MPTAAEALSGNQNTGGTPAGAAGGKGTAPGGAAGAAGPAGSTAANEAFYSGWTDPADKDLADWAKNKNFPDVKTLAASARGYERLIGADRAGRTVVLPNDEYDKDGKLLKADEQGRKDFYAKIGVPQKPEDYKIPVPDGNPYPEFTTNMAKLFQENGLSVRQGQQLAAGYEKVLQGMEAQVRADEDRKSAADMAELQNSWGSHYNERIAFAQRGIEFVSKEAGGLTDIQQRTLEGVLGTPKFMTMMWKIGEGNKEAGFAGGDAGHAEGSKFTGTASTAQARLDTMIAERSAGKITTAQWRDLQPVRDELARAIANGMAQPNA